MHPHIHRQIFIIDAMSYWLPGYFGKISPAKNMVPSGTLCVDHRFPGIHMSKTALFAVFISCY